MVRAHGAVVKKNKQIVYGVRFANELDGGARQPGRAERSGRRGESGRPATTSNWESSITTTVWDCYIIEEYVRLAWEAPW